MSRVSPRGPSPFRVQWPRSPRLAQQRLCPGNGWGPGTSLPEHHLCPPPPGPGHRALLVRGTPAVGSGFLEPALWKDAGVWEKEGRMGRGRLTPIRGSVQFTEPGSQDSTTLTAPSRGPSAHAHSCPCPRCEAHTLSARPHPCPSPWATGDPRELPGGHSRGGAG